MRPILFPSPLVVPQQEEEFSEASTPVAAQQQGANERPTYDPTAVPPLESWLFNWLAGARKTQVVLSEAEKDLAAGISPADRAQEEIRKTRDEIARQAMERISVMPDDEFESLLARIQQNMAPVAAPERPKPRMPNALQIAVALLGGAAHPRFGAEILATPFQAQTMLAEQEYERRKQQAELAERARRDALAFDLDRLLYERQRRAKREEIGLEEARHHDLMEWKRREWDYTLQRDRIKDIQAEDDLKLRKDQFLWQQVRDARAQYSKLLEEYLNAASEGEAQAIIPILTQLGKDAGYPEVLYDPQKLAYERSRRRFQDTVLSRILPHANVLWTTIGQMDEKQANAALDSLMNAVMLAAQSPGITAEDVKYATQMLKSQMPLWQVNTVEMYEVKSSRAIAEARLRLEYQKLAEAARRAASYRQSSLQSAESKLLAQQLGDAIKDYDKAYDDATKTIANTDREIAKLRAELLAITSSSAVSSLEKEAYRGGYEARIAGLEAERRIAQEQQQAAAAGKAAAYRQKAGAPPTGSKVTTSGVRWRIER